jgi:hypothetical protein
MPRIILPSTPSTSDFADAQRRLRAKLGVDVVFLIASDPEWPPGTPLDPETGKPYDPFLDPLVAQVDTEVTKRCSFVHRPLQGIDPTASPIGPGDLGEATVIIDVDDWLQLRRRRRGGRARLRPAAPDLHDRGVGDRHERR